MSTHDRNLSNESAPASLYTEGDAAPDADASFSSEWSEMSIPCAEFMNNVKGIMGGPKLLSHLVDRAEDLIAELASHEEFNQLPFGSPETQIKLNRVFSAMLHYAEYCGGEGGKRYTASSICACRCNERKVTLRSLQSLGTTWVSHLLFVFKGNGSHKAQKNPTPSEHATPTLVSGVPENREERFRAELLKRDGYRCVVTGIRDRNDPMRQPGQSVYRTEACHIIRRAIAAFDAREPTSKASLSAMATLNILSHYASLPGNTIEEIKFIIDDPSNGMTLQGDVHFGFDQFAWSLKEVPNSPNTYEVHRYTEEHGFMGNTPERVTFRDSSALYLESSSPPRKKRRNTRSGNVGDQIQQDQGIPLPNPHFLRIHSALAGVLHMSGAAEEIDAVIKRSGSGGAPGALVGADFERICKLASLRSSCIYDEANGGQVACSVLGRFSTSLTIYVKFVLPLSGGCQIQLKQGCYVEMPGFV